MTSPPPPPLPPCSDLRTSAPASYMVGQAPALWRPTKRIKMKVIIRGGNVSLAYQDASASGSTGLNTGRFSPSETVAGRSQSRPTRGREARSAGGQSTSPMRPRVRHANPVEPPVAMAEVVALTPSPPVVSIDTISLAPMASVLP